VIAIKAETSEVTILALFALCCEQYSATKTAAAILQRYSFSSSYYSWMLFLKDQVSAANN
jgi:hypothetical protein